MNLPRWIRTKPAAERALADDPRLWRPLLTWSQALARAEDEGSAAGFIQRGGLAIAEWDDIRIAYVARFTEEGALRFLEIWKIERVVGEGS